MNIHLVPDWRQSWRWFSMQAQAISAGLLFGWNALPPDWQRRVPVWLIMGMVCAVLILGMIGRVVQQAPPVLPLKGADDQL